MKKLLSKEDLQKIKFKKGKKKIGLCHGVFDIFHIGHLKHLQAAKKKCDILIVSITKDQFINKGINQPKFNHFLRAELLSELTIVNGVFINQNKSASDVISILKPDYYFKGVEYRNKKLDLTKKIYEEENLVKKYKGKIIYTNEITFSSSNIFNELSNYSKDQKNFLRRVKEKYSSEKMLRTLENLLKKNINIFGEIILDEYVFCKSLGKSGKDPFLVINEIDREVYQGGSLAIANIASHIYQKVNIFSYIGSIRNTLSKFKKKLNKNIYFNLVKKKNSPTIIKTRFVDRDSNIKILGVYDFNDKELDKDETRRLKSKIKKNNELAIICDYGHGLLNNDIINEIFKRHKHIMLNIQLNAANQSYHSILKYNKNIFSLVINENELRHEMRERNLEIKQLIKNFSTKIKAKHILVTRGSSGLIYYSKISKKFSTCPAYGGKIIDKVGSGDTVLVIFTSLLAEKIDPDIAMLIASLGASKNLEAFANKNVVKLSEAVKSTEHILK
jgi:cytidyltransferase-like protein